MIGKVIAIKRQKNKKRKIINNKKRRFKRQIISRLVNRRNQEVNLYGFIHF
jgi:hypothetical protein